MKSINICSVILRWLELLLRGIALACFSALVIVVVLQIISRLLLPWTFAWTEELSRFLFIGTVCSISPVALRQHEFVYVDIFINKFAYKDVLNFVLNLVLAIFLLAISLPALRFMQLGYANTSPVLHIPMWIAYSLPFICFLFLLVFTIEKLFWGRLGVSKEES